MNYDQLDTAATRAYAKAIDACAIVWNDLYMKDDKARGATKRLDNAIDAARKLAAHDGNGRLEMLTCEPWQAASAVLEMAHSLPAGKRKGVPAAYRAIDAAYKALEAFKPARQETLSHDKITLELMK